MSEIVDKQQKLVSLNLLVVNQPNIQLTASLAAWLLTLVPEDLWEDSELSMLRDGVVAACKHFKELTTERSVAKCDPRFEKDGQTLANRTPPITIYTDYDLILSTGVPAFLKLVDSVSEADFIYTVKNVSNFLSLPLNQRICQFPYEAGLIRKVFLSICTTNYQ